VQTAPRRFGGLLVARPQPVACLGYETQGAQTRMPSEYLCSWAMAKVVLFHHELGLTDPSAVSLQRWRDAGHTVHTPDRHGGPMAIVGRAQRVLEFLG
jgi:hypothetical protein